MRLLNTLMLPLVVVTNGMVKIRQRIIILASILFITGSAAAQTLPYMTIVTNPSFITVVDPVSTGPVGSASMPTRLDFGSGFTIYVYVDKSYRNSGKTLFLYMQDTQTGTGGINNWWLQGASIIGNLQFSGPESINDDVDRYHLDISAGQYPVLMNSGTAWTNLLNGSIIRPTLYVGFTASPSTIANWGDAVINFIDIWGYKGRMNITDPQTSNYHPDVIIEIDQYTPINKNLEQMLLDGVESIDSINVLVGSTNHSSFTLPAGDYTWYMKDEYGISPYTYLVNNPNPWLNNIYQAGFKPWINSTHIDTVINMSTVGEFWFPNSSGNPYVICYTLTYYVIPTSKVPSPPANPYVDPDVFNQFAQKVMIKIKPYIMPPIPGAPPWVPGPSPFITNAFTIASQDYGSAPAGTQWGTLKDPTETNYSLASGNLPSDGQYSIAQDILGVLNNGYRPMDWYVPPGGAWAPAKKYDHTSGDGTGFMYIVNADAANGIFYQKPFTVCPDMNLQLSCWLANICDGTRDNSSYNSQYRIKPNVHIQIYAGRITTPSGNLLLDYYTGEIPMTGTWEKYFTPIFRVPSGVEQITVFYLSVNEGGNGNDFMLDDIQIQRTNGAFDFSLTNVSQCLSSANDRYNIQAIWDTTVIKQMYENEVQGPPNQFDYQWTYYQTTILDSIPNMVGKPLSNGTSPYPTGTISIDVRGDSAGVYQLAIAAGQGTGQVNENCATLSYYVFSPTPKPMITAVPGTAGTICAGTPASLSIQNLAISIDASKLWWYSRPQGGVEVPLLDSNGNQLTGTSITVRPTVTTTYIARIANCSDSIVYRMTVGGAQKIGFGQSSKEEGYAYRVCYTADTVRIPISYLNGNGNMNYYVFLNGVANADTIVRGILPASGKDTIAFNPQRIRPNVNEFRNGMNQVTCAVALKDNTGDCGQIQTFNIRFISDFSVWIPGTDNTNWNNDANWYITDSLNNRYAQGGVPMACTNVVIPGNVINYPELQANYSASNLPTDDGFDPVPKCNSITFQYGGEVAQLQYLQYVKAFVELNLGTYNSGGGFSNTANMINTDNGSNYYTNYFYRDRYFSMSAPLKDMYSGDFAFGGKPDAYMKYADTIQVKDINPEAKLIQQWTNSINSYNVPFPAGFGFGYEVYSGDLQETWPYKNNQKNLNSALGIVRWPYFMNKAYLDSINPLHTFSGNATTGAGISTFTYFPVGTPESPLLSETDEVTRKSTSVPIDNIVTQTFYKSPVTVPLANRFIVENDANTIPSDSPKLSFRNELIGKEVLIGNPFMSHLDFQSFYVQDSTQIGDYYRVWLGTTSQYYSVQVDPATGSVSATTTAPVSGDSIIGNDLLIAPLQSFFVKIKANTKPVTFDIGTMSVTKSNKVGVLRSSGRDAAREVLKITAANSRYSATVAIVHKPGEKHLGEGVPKLFTPNGNIPEIYLIQDYKKEIIEINETPQAIPLEISTKITGGDLKLTFTGLENFSSQIALKDMKTGETKTLSALDNVYSFKNNEGDQKNRFFLLFNGYTGIDAPAPQYVSVFAANHRIHAEASSLDPIRSVEIYNLMGQPVESTGKLSTVSYESHFIGEKGIYIIQIKTKNNASVTKKIIIY